MKPRLAAVLRFLVLCLANLLSDAVQIESLLGTAGLIAGVAMSASAGNPQALRIAGAVVTAVSVLTVALPKAIAAGRSAETDLELLLKMLGGAQ